MSRTERRYLLLNGQGYHNEDLPWTDALTNWAKDVDPLGIRTVSALLKQAAQEARIPVDVRLETMHPGRVHKLEDEISAADAVLCSARFIDTVLAQQVIGMAGQHNIPIISGGYGPTFNEGLYYDSTTVAYGVEAVAGELFEDLFTGSLKPRYGEYSPYPLEPEDFVEPDRSFPSKSLFQKITGRRRESVTWMWGCSNRCTYCVAVKMQLSGGSDLVRWRSSDSIIGELEKLNLPRGSVLFLTDNNTGCIDRKELKTNLAYLREKGLYFITESSLGGLLADYREFGEEESLLALMSPKLGDGGCIGLAYGADDLGRRRVAGSQDKDITALKEGAPILRKLGIPLNLIAMVGLDKHESPRTFFEIARVLEEVEAPVHFFHIASPYRGHPYLEGRDGWGDKMYREGRVFEHDSLRFNHHNVVHRPVGMTVDQLQQGFHWLNRRIYNLAAIKKHFQRNFDPRFAREHLKLATFTAGLPWSVAKRFSLMEMQARGLVDMDYQRELDGQYQAWKKREA